MSLRVIGPATLGLAALGVALWSYRRDLVGAESSSAARVRAFGPVFIAAAIATFSGEHFTDAVDLVRLVPHWLPIRIGITYVVGVALLAAGVSLAVRRATRWSTVLLAVLFALFVLLIYLPSAMRHPRLHIVWIFPFREGTFAVAAFSIFVIDARPAWSDGYSAFVRYWAAFVSLFYGALNLSFPQYAPGVPSEVTTATWVPFPRAIAYVTGAVLLALGAAALVRKTAAAAAITGVGILMTVLAIALYGPAFFFARGAGQVVTAINFVADTLLFAGSMLVMARLLAERTAVAAGDRSGDGGGIRPSKQSIGRQHEAAASKLL